MIDVYKHSQYQTNIKLFSKNKLWFQEKPKSPGFNQESRQFDNIYTFRNSMCDTAALSNENALLHLSKNYYAHVELGKHLI